VLIIRRRSKNVHAIKHAEQYTSRKLNFKCMFNPIVSICHPRLEFYSILLIFCHHITLMYMSMDLKFQQNPRTGTWYILGRGWNYLLQFSFRCQTLSKCISFLHVGPNIRFSSILKCILKCSKHLRVRGVLLGWEGRVALITKFFGLI